jgi:hypothetical protein
MEVKRPTMKTWRKDAHGERGGVRVDKVSKIWQNTYTTNNVIDAMAMFLIVRQISFNDHLLLHQFII